MGLFPQRVWIEEVASIVGAERVSTASSDRVVYARDVWPRMLLSLEEGAAALNPPDAVCWPVTTSEVEALVRLARARSVPLVSYGAGSGVCGAAVPVAGGLIVDLKRMRKAIFIDEANRTARFEAGMLGVELERRLLARGWTLGHYPSSLNISTLGGWLATRSAGQCSSKFGKIEDMVVSLEAVLGTGERVEVEIGRRAPSGVDWMEALLGSEGAYAVITAATLRIQPAAEVASYRAWTFPTLEAGLEAMRRLMQRSLRPTVMRLYDPLDSALQLRHGRAAAAPTTSSTGSVDLHAVPGYASAGHSAAVPSSFDVLLQELVERVPLPARMLAPRVGRTLASRALGHAGWLNRAARGLAERWGHGQCVLITGFEGAKGRTEIEAAVAGDELMRADGIDLGPGLAERWRRGRFDVAFGQGPLFAAGAFVDTMEVACRWSKLVELYHGVVRALSPHVLVMAHFSHAYVDGCSIYFTFIGPRADRDSATKVYDAAWSEGLLAASRAGATIAHHHGVGLLKAPLLPREHGDAERIIAALKTALDPDGVLNPGKLGIHAS